MTELKDCGCDSMACPDCVDEKMRLRIEGDLDTPLTQLAQNIQQLNTAIVGVSGSYNHYDKVVGDYKNCLDRNEMLYLKTLETISSRTITISPDINELIGFREKLDAVITAFNRHTNPTSPAGPPGPGPHPCHSDCETIHNIECPNGTPMKHEAERDDSDQGDVTGETET